MYVDDAGDVLPDNGWAPGPYVNARHKLCGGEWRDTPAVQLYPYLKEPLVWVCPSKRRGLTYRSEKGTFDPSITGFLSYGFNYAGVFFPSGSPGQSQHSASIENPAQTVAITECNGTDVPGDSGGMGTSKADAAWLDPFWAYNSYPGQPDALQTGYDPNTNYRFQSQQRKHAHQVNVMFLDAHAEMLPPSRLKWGQFFATYHGNVPLFDRSHPWDAPVSSPALDASSIPP
jgi:prepilin-type processing-associated H-X9-DG protein